MPGITLREVGGELVINVPNEAVVIGRGPFLKVTDKRVSRSHALLEVSEGKLYITPTHTNPCFLRTQGSREQKVLARDVKQVLDDGDEFGLLTDQLFYKVSYPQLNGIGRDRVKNKDIKVNKDKDYVKMGDNTPNETSVDVGENKKPQITDDGEINSVCMSSKKEKDAKGISSQQDFKQEITPTKISKGLKDIAIPLIKKRNLPDWMIKIARTPTQLKATSKKPVSRAVNKKKPDTKSKAEYIDDVIDDEEDEYTSQKPGRGRAAKDCDEDYEEEPSDDDYVPEKPSRSWGGKSQKKKRISDSENDYSDDDDDDDDYSPKKSKQRTASKGKGAASGKKASMGTPRSRSKKKNSDDDDDEVLPRKRRGEEKEEESVSRRPQRAARQKKGSYVDDPMLEEALEDFPSDDNEDANEDKDSDFKVEGEEDSGSDWEMSASSSQKQKTTKAGRNRGSPRGSHKKVAGKKKRRRQSNKAFSDSDDDEDIIEDDEPYIPRPSKRRRAPTSPDSDESDEGRQKKNKRAPCQYGKKCYRKNPVHFKTFCHPGDSSYDEDDKDSSGPKESSRKEFLTSSEKPSRPQRTTAGTRLVTHRTEDDDLPDTYDYNDSFIDDGTQHSDESRGNDSDCDAEENIREFAKDAKKFLKSKKLTKPFGSD